MHNDDKSSLIFTFMVFSAALILFAMVFITDHYRQKDLAEQKKECYKAAMINYNLKCES